MIPGQQNIKKFAVKAGGESYIIYGNQDLHKP